MPEALLVGGAAQVATLEDGPARGSAQGSPVVLESHATDLGVLCLEGRIDLVGPEAVLGVRMASLGLAPERVSRVDAAGGLVTPGLVDPHTHLPFAGTRETELRLRQEGVGYLGILAAGGGILSTVERTRAASTDELIAHVARWSARMLAEGVTTAEAKSGYGLDTATEMRLLEAIAAVGARSPIDLVPTFLGAHAVPRELAGRPDATEAYVRCVVEEQLPAVAGQGIAEWCDVFCEAGVFDAAQSRRVLEAGLRHGLRPRLHADEIADTGGATLAADLGAASADHLGAISESGIAALASAADRGRPVVATLLPATSLYLMSEHAAPARRLIEAGVPVALGTDFNPGTSPTPSLPLVMSLACIELGMAAREALVAATANAAFALGLDDEIGTLRRGARADLVVWDVESVDRLPYWLGARLARTVVKAGRVVVDRGVGS